jgi:hypothetical protein
MRSIALFLTIGPAPALRAQAPSSGAAVAAAGQIGRTVRITAGPARPLTGSLQRVQGDTFYVAGPNDSFESISAARVSRLEVSEPLSPNIRQQRGLLGSGVGILLGGALGYAVAVPRVRRAERQHSGPFEQIEYVTDPMIGALIGGIVGFNVGHSPTGRWIVRYSAPTGMGTYSSAARNELRDKSPF